MDELLAECQRVIGYHFANTQLLAVAMTHSSLRTPDRECNERLEFLGDSVLGLVVTEELYRLLPDQAEGELTRLKSAIVSRGSLFHASQRLGLVRFAEFARGVGRSDELPVSVTANLVEAVIGAIYLDAGFFPAREFVLRHLGRELEETLSDRGAKNYKSLLQHEVQDVWQTTPTYRTLEEGGPDHRKQFTIAAVIRGAEWGRASGTTKKEAEQEAARLALEAFQRRGRGRRRRRSGRGEPAGGYDAPPATASLLEREGHPYEDAPIDAEAQGPLADEAPAVPREGAGAFTPEPWGGAAHVAEGSPRPVIAPEPDVEPDLDPPTGSPEQSSPPPQRGGAPERSAPEHRAREQSAREDGARDPVERRARPAAEPRARGPRAPRRSAPAPAAPTAPEPPAPGRAPPAGEDAFAAGIAPAAPPPPAPSPPPPPPAPAGSVPARRKAPAAWTPPKQDEDGFGSGL